jgi:hypothetical protein
MMAILLPPPHKVDPGCWVGIPIWTVYERLEWVPWGWGLEVDWLEVVRVLRVEVA